MQPVFTQTRAYLSSGTINNIYGNIIEATAPPESCIGDVCAITSVKHTTRYAEIIGFKDRHAVLMPYTTVDGIQMGARLTVQAAAKNIHVGQHLLGKIVDAFAVSLTGETFPQAKQISTTIDHFSPTQRKPITEKLVTGVSVIDSLITLGKGQRVGIFAGSGVGKSTLLNMIARHAQQQICVIAMIGERGREVYDFLNHLTDQQRQHIVTVVATSDQSAILRKQAAYTATAIAQYFSQQGHDVLLMMDSITRLAMAQREIGLATGEMPTSRGYTASTFSILPQLLECCGHFKDRGSISAVYTVLVEGDDFNEPIADYTRASLDGHIILSRQLAHRGQFPAIDILKSNSRLFNALTDHQTQALIRQVKSAYQLLEKYQDIIALGGYESGSNSALDQALIQVKSFDQLFMQTTTEYIPYAKIMTKLNAILKEI